MSREEKNISIPEGLEGERIDAALWIISLCSCGAY